MTYKTLTQVFARLCWRSGLVAWISSVTVLGQTTLTLSPVNDAYVNDSAPDTVFNNSWLVAGRSPAEFTPRYRSFLRFNLGGIPTNATVYSAVLHLNLQSLEGGSTAPIELRRVLATWSSATLTWNSQPATTAPVTTTTVGSSIGADYIWSITGLVQGWVSEVYTNDGLSLRIVNETTATATRTFASANHATRSIRPQLVVTYRLPPDINVSPTSLAFGNQPVGTSSTAQTVTVQNVGGSDLTVSSIGSSSTEFVVVYTGGLPTTVGTNSSLTFQVRFAPTSPGLKNATVTIASNDPDEPTRAVSCSGTGTAPDITVAPASLAFGNQLLNTLSPPQTVTVSNSGNAALTVSAITTSSTVEFPLSNVPSLPVSLAPGAGLSFQAQFKPTGIGARNGTTTITSNDPDEASVPVGCSGTGTAPDIAVAPNSLSFGNHLLNTTSAPQTVTVSNAGNALLTVNAISSGSAEFPLSGLPSLPVSLSPGAAFNFQVRFRPASLGARGTTVSITSSDPDETSVSVACGGTGVAPDIEVNPTALNFDNQAANTLSAPQSIVVSNTGSATLTVNAVSSSSTEFLLNGVPSLPAGLQPSGSLGFEVRFLPANVGARSGTVSIASNDPDKPTVAVACTGTGVGPRLAVTPSAISFGTVTLGTTARRALALENLGNANLVITVITSTIPVFRLGNLPPFPLTLAPGQMRTVSLDYTPSSVQSIAGSVCVESNDPFTPGVVVTVGGNSAPPIGTGCGQVPVDGVEPVIISPVHDSTNLLGNPITFQAINNPNAAVFCHADCDALCWYFRKVPDQQWTNVVGYQFMTNRLLGCDQAMPLPGDYEVMVTMCGVTSAPIAFHVVLNPGITDASQRHPLFAVDPDDNAYRCEFDWTDPLNPNRLSTAHFNVIWTTNGYNEGDPCNAPSGGFMDNRPNDLRLGLLECAWATFDRWMTSPLDDAALFQDLPEYSSLTNLTWWAGGWGGGGVSQPVGFGYEQKGRTEGNSRLPVHEMFHTWDYAGNPLHNKRRFDKRHQGNPYVFFHEGPMRIAQTLATNAPKMYGFKTDQWPVWTPLDIGLIELAYDSGIFWSYLLNTYSFSPRLSWEGPPICACAQWAEPNRLPHNFELFELWNARVRECIRAELGPNRPLTDYACPDQHWPPDGDDFFIYNGHTHPACYQTLEYELAVIEEILRERFSFLGTPLAESVLVDFAVKFAEAFPPRRLTNGMPGMVQCPNLAGLYFSQGFANDGWTDALLCDGIAGFNTNDFYGRIQFRLRDESLQFLRIMANDDATLYVDGRAIIEEPGDTFPDASTTYADQRDDSGAGLDHAYAGTARPASCVVELTDPTRRLFEIEWVNRGDGKGNSDVDAGGNGISRYFLMMEGRGSGPDPQLAPLSADQIEIVSAQFWTNQGSGAPGFARAPTDWNDPIARDKEIQLRPVSSGDRPFFLPPLGVHYHPVASPTGYAGAFRVTVRHDGLTHTRPSAHLLVLTNNTIQWCGPLAQVDDDTQRVILESCGDGSPATYAGNPAVILVVARRTLHGETNGPAKYGTLGAIHYTVGISQQSMPVEVDRYDDPNQLGNPPNNTLADATHLPHIAGGDVFSGPGPGPDRLWNMLVPDLTLYDRTDTDFFRLDLPDEAGDDCLDVLPECPAGASLGNGILEVSVLGTGGAEIIAYDALGNELARDDNYLRVGCPRESGRDPFYFALASQGGCQTAYSLEIRYEVPNAALWERFGRLCIPGGGGGGDDFDRDDFFRVFSPLQVVRHLFVFGIDCDPIVCNPPKHDYLLFHWGETVPIDVEFQHPAGMDFALALLDAQFRFIAGAAPVGGGKAMAPSDVKSADSWISQRLYLTYLPTGYYALRVTATQFGVPYAMRFAGVPGLELKIDPASVALSGGEVRFSWTAEPGRHYRVQFKERLSDPSWTDVGQEIRATAPMATFHEAVSPRPSRFYRVRLSP